MNTLIEADVHFTHFYLSDYKLSIVACHNADSHDVILAFLSLLNHSLDQWVKPLNTKHSTARKMD